MVELALIMPILALLMVGALDLSRAFIAYTRLTNVVREGALYGSHFPDKAADIRVRAYGEAAGQLGTPDVDVIVDATGDIRCYSGLGTAAIPTLPPGDCAAQDLNGNLIVRPGDSIEVTARCVFRPFTAQILRILPPGYTLKKSARMMIQ